MAAPFDHTDRYEKLEQLPVMGPARRHRVREKTLGGHFILNSVLVSPGTGILGELESEVQRASALSSPRLPRVVDMWTVSNELSFVVLEAQGATSLEQLVPPREDARWRLIRLSLVCLKTLHDNNIVHGHLGSRHYCLDENHELCLMDIGMYRRMDSIIRRAEAGSSSLIQLSSNLQERDVADWSLVAGEIMIGGKVLDRPLGSSDYGPAELEVAGRRFQEAISHKPFAEFLARCLKGRSRDGGGFENASEALERFEKIAPRGGILA